MKPRHTDMHLPSYPPIRQAAACLQDLAQRIPDTPLYGLAWVCTPRKLLELASPPRHGFEPSEIFTMRWNKLSPLPYEFKPQVHLAINGKYYLVAMFNAPRADHEKRVGDPEDDLIAAAKEAMAITPDLEPSFMWYRFPLNWVYDT